MKKRIALYFSGRIHSYENSLSYLQWLCQDIDVFMSINGHHDDYHEKFIQELNVKSYFFEDHIQSYRKELGSFSI